MTSAIITNFIGEHILKKFSPKTIDVLTKANITDITLVDDASSDGSVGYVQQYFLHINIIQNNPNIGFSPSSNKGYHVAK